MQDMPLDITITRSDHPRSDAEVAEILANPGFGTHFTDHMFTVEWTPERAGTTPGSRRTGR